MKTIVYVMTGMFCVACSQSPADNASSTERHQVAKQVSAVPCGSPPVLDRSQIEAMLLREGRISEEMSEEERRAEVNAFISRKMQGFSKCGSGKLDSKP